jgi:Domain of unknown function (DUF4190)
MTFPYPSQPTPQYYGPAPGQSQGRSGIAVAALVLGIISIPLCLLTWIDTIVAILAIVFGAVGIAKTKHGQARGRGLAVGGLATGVVGLLASIAVLVGFVLFAVNEAQDCRAKLGHEPSQRELSQCFSDRFNP